MVCANISKCRENVTTKSHFWELFIGLQLGFRGWYMRSSPLECSGVWASGRPGLKPRPHVLFMVGVQNKGDVYVTFAWMWRDLEVYVIFSNIPRTHKQ